jgi:RNA polymerase sigma factor (sigma-70 family)
MIDSSIIDQIINKDNDAFKMMYQKCIRYVYSLVKRYVKNESDHQDVIQEIFARVFLSIKSFDTEKGNFKFWLRRLAINQCLQLYRQGKSPKQFVPIENANEIESGVVHALDELTKIDIQNNLSKMPEGYRQIFMLVVIDEYSHKEVGKLLNITAETSRSQLSRAKQWLQKKITKIDKQKISFHGI